MNKKHRFWTTRLFQRIEPGRAPGAVVVDPQAAAPVIDVLAYSPDDLVEKRIARIAEVQDYHDRWPVVWINVTGLGDAEVIKEIGAQFDLHRLALEDVVNTGQRAKVEEYENLLFVVARMLSGVDDLYTEQVSFFLGENFILTFQERPGDAFDAVRERIRRKRGKIRDHGRDYLLYSLLDAVVDFYFPVLERLDGLVEEIETQVLEQPDSKVIARIHDLKREVRVLRQALRQLCRAVEDLSHPDLPLIGDETRTHCRDCLDHALRATEQAEALEAHAGDLMELCLSLASHRMNEIMKVLTVMASIFMPLTFLAGIYGMNFKYMPELEWPWAYPALLCILASICVGMMLWFRNKKWF